MRKKRVDCPLFRQLFACSARIKAGTDVMHSLINLRRLVESIPPRTVLPKLESPVPN